MIEPHIVTIVGNVVFGVIMALVLIKAFVGLGKGFWKSLNSLIVSLVCYFCIIYFNKSIAAAVYGIDFSRYNWTFPLQEQRIAITTVGETMRSVILALSGESVAIPADSKAFLACDTLALSLISFVTLIIGILLTMFVVSPLLSWAFYHLLFKHLIPKKAREKYKLRVLGFITGGVKALVSCALLISPFSSIVSVASDAAAPYSFDLNDEAKYFKQYVDAYDNSMLAKAISCARVGEETYDAYLTDYATQVFFDSDTPTSFIRELKFAMSITMEGVSEGVYNLEANSIDVVRACSAEFVSCVLEAIAGSSIVTTLLPVALAIVVNLEDVKESVDLTYVDWEGIDWTNELTALDSIYSEFYELDIIQRIWNEDIDSYAIDRVNQEKFHHLFQSLEQSQLVPTILPSLFVSFSKTVGNIFPTELEFYEGIDWGYELSCLYDSLLMLSDLCCYSPLHRNLAFGDLSANETLNTVFQFAFSKDAINGYSFDEASGETEYFYTSDSPELTGKDPMPLSTKHLFSGMERTPELSGKRNAAETIYYGLLDSSLILSNMGNILMTALEKSELAQFDFGQEILEVASTLTMKHQWTPEIDALLHIFSIVNDNPNLSLEHFDVYDEQQVQELKRLTPYIDDSLLIRTIFPPMMRQILGDRELFFGLTVQDLNFECENLGEEIDTLLDLCLDSKALTDALAGDGVSALLDPDCFDIRALQRIMEGLYDSDMLNPVRPDDEVSNFAVVMQNIFAQDSLAEMGFQVSADLIETIDREDREGGKSASGAWMSEISAVCTAFSSLQNADSIKNLMTASGSVKVTDLNGDEIENLLSDMGASRLIEPTIGSVFNRYLQEPCAAMHLNLDFENVADWSIEGSNLNHLISAMQHMESSGFSLENIDITRLNYENADGTTGIDDMADILHSVYQLESARNVRNADGALSQSNAVFAEFIYQNITVNIFGDAYITDTNCEAIRLDHFFGLSDDTAVYSSDGFNKIYVAWEASPGGAYPGEIENIVSLLRYIYTAEDEDGKLKFFAYDEAGNATGISFGSEIDSATLHDLLSRINDIHPFRTVLGSILDQQIRENASMGNQDGDFNLQKANSSLFEKELNYRYEAAEVVTRKQEIDARMAELDLLSDIFENFESVSSAIDGAEANLSMFADLVSSSAGSASTVENLLNDLCSSRIFNENCEGYETETTVFEDVVRYILEKSTLADLMYDETYAPDLAYGSSSAKAQRLVLRVSSGTEEGIVWQNDALRGYVGQISLFCGLLEDAASMQDENGQSLTRFDSIDTLTEDNAKILLKDMNECYLTHDGVATAVNRIFDSIGIGDYILEGTPQASGHTIDEADLSFMEKVDLWNSDIEHLCAIYGETKSEDGGSSGIDTFIVPDGTGQIQPDAFTRLLPHFGMMITTEQQRSDIIYSMLLKQSLEEYVSVYPLSEYTDEHLARRDTVAYLIRAKIEDESEETEEANWTAEGKYLDQLINHFLKVHTHTLDEGEDTQTLEPGDARSLIEATYTYAAELSVTGTALSAFEAKYERGYLSSELVTSFLEKSIERVSAVAPDIRKSDYSYSGLNVFEADGLTGLLEYIQELEEFVNSYKSAEFVYDTWAQKADASVRLMGGALEDERIAYVGMEHYGNSLLATTLFETLVSKHRLQLESIETVLIASGQLSIYNASHEEQFTEEDLHIDWEVNACFTDKAEEWFGYGTSAKAPFRSIYTIARNVSV